ncbi:LOW QUALITY PROTEIN: uncharacterized protein [Venturia canescens]|uniref:LOW QUALITY PROTEIN: uncharacterized protein n=1 Tax=Venturia canescens TaxID=32260 RepID=UPI001C9C6EBC|nr:LOW QUALITY PROTEIN: uncharacterized protein LOC122416812 [Venturia canescens]
MISSKCVKIHGMKDDRWTIKDKINQYRGILKLHGKSIVAHSLVADVKEYRGIVKDVEYGGDKRRMHTLLQEHRDIQLAFENLDPNAIEEGIFQDSCLKRRQLDKFYYEKKKKMKQFFNLKVIKRSKNKTTVLLPLLFICMLIRVFCFVKYLLYERREKGWVVAMGESRESRRGLRSFHPLWCNVNRINYKIFMIKLECTILSDKYEREGDNLPNYHGQHEQHQGLTTEHHRFVAKRNAAKSIRATYEAMLKILEKDAKYFDAVLESLQEDRICQCKIMLKATVMGQLAAENLDDTRQRYKSLGKQVWINMKERERTLSLVRSQVQDLWAYAQSLVRVESETNNTPDIDVASEERSNSEETPINRQIEQLEETFNRVKNSLGVRSYDEFLSRLDYQMKHRTRLLAQFKKNFNDRDTFLNLKNHALLSLATLEHGTLTTTGRYKTEKRTMLREIENQKRRESDYRTMRKSRGKLLVEIRAALQNMLGMLICVEEQASKRAKKEKDSEKTKKDKKEEAEEEEDDDGDEANKKRKKEARIDFKFEGGALNLLSRVSGKVNTLFAMSNIELDPGDEARAKDLYQRYVADHRSKLKYEEEEEAEPTGILVEHETIDSTILSRAEVKLRSKQLVEANAKLE